MMVEERRLHYNWVMRFILLFVVSHCKYIASIIFDRSFYFYIRDNDNEEEEEEEEDREVAATEATATTATATATG